MFLKYRKHLSLLQPHPFLYQLNNKHYKKKQEITRRFWLIPRNPDIKSPLSLTAIFSGAPGAPRKGSPGKARNDLFFDFKTKLSEGDERSTTPTTKTSTSATKKKTGEALLFFS
ncbi:MAG: hypothetical protein R3B65_00645 [Candidatus Paceibacterota bacterium]